ncbi:MAG: hypothetical protein K9J25_04180 [Bacteroidales bacterium]|nr:hypothetical protein [Bacteroidales bacterium]
MTHFIGILVPVLIIIVSSFIIWRSTDGFETAADFLGRKMNNGIKGATINAIASSMPEFLATLFFLFYVADEGTFTDSLSGGLGITAGSAVFNLVIIPASILLVFRFSGKSVSLPIRRRMITRDGLVLILANILILVLISKPTIRAVDGFILLAFYLVYLVILRLTWQREEAPGSSYSPPDIAKTVNIPRAIMCIDLNSWILGGKKIKAPRAWLLLLVSVIVMSAGTWLLVKGTSLLGEEEYPIFGKTFYGLNFPLIFASVLLAAAASSIPDTMISIRDARKGNFDDSISNALGSNIFDISFAIGLPILLYTLIHGSVEMSEGVRIWSVTTWVILFFINIIVITLFMSARKLGWRSGLFLLAIYAAFVFFIIEEGADREWISRIVSEVMSMV